MTKSLTSPVVTTVPDSDWILDAPKLTEWQIEQDIRRLVNNPIDNSDEDGDE